jgi:hypothetical protein
MLANLGPLAGSAWHLFGSPLEMQALLMRVGTDPDFLESPLTNASQLAATCGECLAPVWQPLGNASITDASGDRP